MDLPAQACHKELVPVVISRYISRCVVCDVAFHVIRVSDIDKRAESISKASQTVLEDFSLYTTVSLAGRPNYISFSSDSTTVSVCLKDQQTNVIHLYDIQSFKAPVLNLF